MMELKLIPLMDFPSFISSIPRLTKSNFKILGYFKIFKGTKLFFCSSTVKEEPLFFSTSKIVNGKTLEAFNKKEC